MIVEKFPNKAIKYLAHYLRLFVILCLFIWGNISGSAHIAGSGTTAAGGSAN